MKRWLFLSLLAAACGQTDGGVGNSSKSSPITQNEQRKPAAEASSQASRTVKISLPVASIYGAEADAEAISETEFTELSAAERQKVIQEVTRLLNQTPESLNHNCFRVRRRVCESICSEWPFRCRQVCAMEVEVECYTAGHRTNP